MRTLVEIDTIIAALTDCLRRLDAEQLSIPALHIDRALHALQAERLLLMLDQGKAASDKSPGQ